MATSLRSDLRAVWSLRMRRSLASLEFWLIIIGYDTHKHSFPNKGYLVYVILFFSVWIFAVLTLVADFAGKFLSLLSLASPLTAAVWVGIIGLLAVGLGQLHGASRRSPFIFSEADAMLLNQTPLDRRAVTLIWMLAAWVERGLFIWLAAVILGYALLEARSVQDLTTGDLPRYILAGGRALLVFIPLHLCLQALTAAAGAARLRGKRDLPALRQLAPLLLVGLVGLSFITGVRSFNDLPVWLWPLSYPVRAALGDAPLLPGWMAALIEAGLGVYVLWRASYRFNLSRAIEETRALEAFQAAQLLGMIDVTQEIRQRERLGAGRRSSPLPIGRGFWAVLWRNVLQAARTMSIGEVSAWIGILGLGLGIQLISDRGPRLVMALFWIFLLGQQAVVPLRRDLRRWWLMRQLPFSTDQLAVLDLAAPALMAGLLTTGAAVVLAALSAPGLPAAGWLAIPAAIGVALSAGVDLLVQCKTNALVAGKVPEVSLLMLLLGALVLGAAGGAIWLAQAVWLLPMSASIFTGVFVCLAADMGLFLWVRGLTRRMK